MRRFVFQLLKNQLFPNQTSPLELIFFVTKRCNFRCKHCFIKNFAKNGKEELSLKEIEVLAKELPRLLTLMITGGEPFLRHDLSDIVLLFSRLNHPKVVSLVTNGFLTKKIEKQIGKILTSSFFKVHLVVAISLEGPEKIHDEIRNRKGAFKAAMETMKILKNISKQHSNLSAGINITMTKVNQKQILNFCRQVGQTGLPDFISLNLIRCAKRDDFPTGLNMKYYRKATEFAQNYSRSYSVSKNYLIDKLFWAKERYQAFLIEKIYSSKLSPGLACEAGRGIGVVDFDGKVYPCEMTPVCLGSIREKSFSQIWTDKKTVALAKEIRDSKCFCTHECFLSASINLNPKEMLNALTLR